MSVAHDRIDRCIQVRFHGKNAGKIPKDHIKAISDEKNQFTVKSRRDPDAEYRVDMTFGTCSCIDGSNRSPCSHQLAVVLHYRRMSMNCISTLHAIARRQLAFIVHGNEANRDISAVSQCHDETMHTDTVNEPCLSLPGCFSVPEGSRYQHDKSDSDKSPIQDQLDPVHLLDSVVTNLNKHLSTLDSELRLGVKKFIDHYNSMKVSHSTALMASSFHCFGSSNSGTVTHIQGGAIRRGRRLPVQAMASGRRKTGSKGKAPAPAGRPPIAKLGGKIHLTSSRYDLPLRDPTKGKHPHNLAVSIKKEYKMLESGNNKKQLP